MSTEPDTNDYDTHDHGTPQDDEDCGCREHSECENCDPDLIDDLACQAEGIQAQADYNAKTQPDLKTASDDYTKARSDYRTARSTATLEVQDLRHQAKQLVERVRCQIEQKRIVECLDTSYQHVCKRLEKCGVGGGCCSSDDCTFDKTCPDSYAELVSRIAGYTDRLEVDKACFNSLKGEAEALKTRIAAVKKEIDDINAALAGDPATIDLKKQYVAALVALRHLRWDMIWNGFQHTQDYIDCLCRALTCWTKANDAISVLTGCKAVMDSQQKVRDKCCENLRTKTVDEILLEYERICGTETCKDDGESPDSGYDDGPTDGDEGDDEGDGEGDGEGGYGNTHQDDDDHDQGGGYGEDGEDGEECGCGHGHRHRRGHHRHRHGHDDGRTG